MTKKKRKTPSKRKQMRKQKKAKSAAQLNKIKQKSKSKKAAAKKKPKPKQKGKFDMTLSERLHSLLHHANKKREEKNLKPLTHQEAKKLLDSHKGSDDPGFDVTGFLVGFTTGIPVGAAGISAAALVGAAMHSESNDRPAPVETGTQSSPSSDGGSSSSSSGE